MKVRSVTRRPSAPLAHSCCCKVSKEPRQRCTPAERAPPAATATSAPPCQCAINQRACGQDDMHVVGMPRPHPSCKMAATHPQSGEPGHQWGCKAQQSSCRRGRPSGCGRTRWCCRQGKEGDIIQLLKNCRQRGPSAAFSTSSRQAAPGACAQTMWPNPGMGAATASPMLHRCCEPACCTLLEPPARPGVHVEAALALHVHEELRGAGECVAHTRVSMGQQRAEPACTTG